MSEFYGSTKPRHEVCTDSLKGAVKVSGSGFESGFAICGNFFSSSSPSWPLLSPKRGAARRPCTDSSPRAHAFRRKKSPKMPHRGPTLAIFLAGALRSGRSWPKLGRRRHRTPATQCPHHRAVIATIVEVQENMEQFKFTFNIRVPQRLHH